MSIFYQLNAAFVSRRDFFQKILLIIIGQVDIR